jgi:hypothetical protein
MVCSRVSVKSLRTGVVHQPLGKALEIVRCALASGQFTASAAATPVKTAAAANAETK